MNFLSKVQAHYITANDVPAVTPKAWAESKIKYIVNEIGKQKNKQDSGIYVGTQLEEDGRWMEVVVHIDVDAGIYLTFDNQQQWRTKADFGAAKKAASEVAKVLAKHLKVFDSYKEWAKGQKRL